MCREVWSAGERSSSAFSRRHEAVLAARARLPTGVPMNFLRSERWAAALLLIAAVLGLLVANLPFGADVVAVKNAHIDLAWLGLDLSVGHWTSDGLLAIFFFIVAVELKRELVIGELNSLSKALLPAIAAVGGVVVPALDLRRVHGRHRRRSTAGRSPRRPTSPSRSACSRCSARGCPPACACSCSPSRCSTTSSRSSSSRSSSRATPTSPRSATRASRSPCSAP